MFLKSHSPSCYIWMITVWVCHKPSLSKWHWWWRWTQQIVSFILFNKLFSLFIKSVQNNTHLIMIPSTLSMLPNKPLLNHLSLWIVIWKIKTNPHCCFFILIIISLKRTIVLVQFSEKNQKETHSLCSCSFHLTLSLPQFC